MYNISPVSSADRLYFVTLLRKLPPLLAEALAGLANPRVRADFLGVEVDGEAGRKQKTFI